MIEYKYPSEYFEDNGLTYILGSIANGEYKASDDYIEYYKDGKYHREGGPAIISPSIKEWFQNGEPYRENNLPHVERDTGIVSWVFNNKDYYNFNEYLLAKMML